MEKPKLIDFKKIKRYFESRKKVSGDVSVLRDWQVVLVSFFVLLIMVFFADAYIYWTYWKETEEEIMAREIKSGILSEENIKIILDEIDNRKKTFEKYLSEAPNIKEPFTKIESEKTVKKSSIMED